MAWLSKLHLEMYKRFKSVSFFNLFLILSLNAFCTQQMPCERGCSSCHSESLSSPKDNDPKLVQEVLAALSLIISPPPLLKATFHWLIISKYDQHVDRKDTVTGQSSSPRELAKDYLITSTTTDGRWEMKMITITTEPKPRIQEHLSIIPCSSVISSA